MTFDLAKFRLVYPQFNTADDALVLALAEQAECYLPSGCDGCLDQLVMLLVAHMLSIRTASGTGGGLAVASASEGGISVSLAMPANADARGQWLNITPFGQQYAALAARCGKGKAAAGLFIGGYPEGDAFRRVYGVFPWAQAMKIAQDNSGSKALEKLADQIKKSKLEVGFFETAVYPDGIPVAYIAATHEFGNPAEHIPSRPFFRNAISQNDGWKDLANKAISAVVEGRMELNQALNQMGLKMSADVKDSITDGSYEALKQSTLDARQSRKRTQGVASKPLIDTGQMLQSVTYAVNGEMK